MASLIDRVLARLGYERKAKTEAPYARSIRLGVSPGSPKRGTKLLRHFGEQNEWVRIAINRRKHQLGSARWQIVRTDDPEAPPDKAVVKNVTTLFRTVNQKRESFRSLLDQVVEDLLVLDAGCIEKEKTVGGEILALHAVDGASIIVDPRWDGSKPNEPRYFQFYDFHEVAKLRNDELIYMMHNPATYRVTGWSPVETLVRIIEAELYGEQYDFDQLKSTAPEGLLWIGAGLSDRQVSQFREYYDSEIAGTKNTAIMGGGVELGGTGSGGAPSWLQFKRSNAEQQRMEYKKWLANKIAAAFEMSKTVFGLVDDINRSSDKGQQANTDEGIVGLSTLVEEFITREIVWEFDENHGFKFDGLIARDEIAQSTMDATYLDRGALTINEVRNREGRDSVPWGDVPFKLPIAGSTLDPEGNPIEPPEPAAPGGDPNDGAPSPKGGSKTIRPFARRSQSRRMSAASFSYLRN